MDVAFQRKVDNYLGRIGIALLRPATMALGAILRRDHTLTAGREIVWIKMLGGGSLILAAPMLLGIRRAHPGTRMVLITTPSVRPFAELLGVFDEIRVIDNRGALALTRSAARAFAQTFRADCIVDLEVHSRLTTVFTTLTMARNRVSFWLEDIFWRRGLASHLVFFNRSSGSYHFYDRIAELFDATIASQAECRASILAACGIATAPPRDSTLVSVGFACSDLGKERMLTPAQWVKVFGENLRPGLRRFVLLGGPADRDRGEEIIAELRNNFPELVFENHCGASSLRDSTATLFASAEFWGIDSSLLHLARIAGTRCVSYWGPTDPSTRLRHGWTVDEVTHYRKIACSPCVHTSEAPPCNGNNRCIRALFSEEAISEGWTPVEYPPTRSSRALTNVR